MPLDDFNAAVRVGQRKLAPAGTDSTVQRIRAQAAARRDWQIAGDAAEGRVGVDVVADALRDLGADGRERSLQYDIPAAAGRTRCNHRNSAGLLVPRDF